MKAEGIDTPTIEKTIRLLKEDPANPDLPRLDKSIIDYALKLNDTPAAIQEEDIEQLRESGLEDRAIHDLAAIVAYFAFVNRIADGLGVELESHLTT